MTEIETPIKKTLADNKITIPPLPFLIRFGYETGVELFRSPRAVMRSPLAFRSLSKGAPNKDAKKAEAALLRRISHPNIAGFRMSSKRSKIRYLATESSALFLGEIIERKITNNYIPFLPKHIVKVAADIASALDYLHTKVQILHGDIKSYNILVTGKFEICKLCDFTVAVPLDENGVFDNERAGQAVYPGIKNRWSAPEVMRDGQISCKTDIWSLGLTLWEMLALMPPHAVPGCTCGAPSADDNDAADDILGNNFQSLKNYYTARYGTRPAIPVNVSERMYMHALTLFYWCTETLPARRVSARHLSAAAADMLQHLRYAFWFPHTNHGEPLCRKS